MTTLGDDAASAFEALWDQIAAAAPAHLWRGREAGLVAVVTEIPAASLNGVWAFRPDVAPADVRSLLGTVSRSGYPFCLVARATLRETLAPIAAELGLVADPDVPLMVLDDPVDLSAATRPDGLDVRLLDADELVVHERLMAAGFEMPETLAHDLVQFFGGLPGLRAFVGTVDGADVTTAVAMPSARSVGIFDVATPPTHRRRGYGAAVTATAVLDAMARGAGFAWLQSSAAGLPVYERLGFRVVESWPVWVTPPAPSPPSTGPAGDG